MPRERVYHGESCKGVVTTNFFVDGKTVEAYFSDGDISSSFVKYHAEENDGEYKLVETEDLSTPLDGSWGKNPNKIKTHKLKAATEEEAIAAMIDIIVGPYEKPRPHSMPVDAAELRSGLEKALLQ